MEYIEKEEYYRLLKERIKDGYWLYPNLVKFILTFQNRKIKVSLDLNRTFTEIPAKKIITIIGRKNIEKILKGGDVVWYFDKENKKLFKIQIFDEETQNFYKLYPTKRAPTIEINGVKMHRTKEIDPFEDARQKVSSLEIEGGIVLDTCMGCGYTAIWASKFAEKVITVEVDRNIIELDSWNPWCLDLFGNEKIEIIQGDVFNVVNNFEDEYFDYIIHDPPAFYMAEKLYSKEFYKKLYRILKYGGKLYHYTGTFGERRGIDIQRTVMENLKEVGFEVERRKDIVGVLAIKK